MTIEINICPKCGRRLPTATARQCEPTCPPGTECQGVIDLQQPIASERRRGFQPPYYTVYVYQCPDCQRKVYVRANSFRGTRPVPGHGAIRCGGPIPGFASTYRGEPAS